MKGATPPPNNKKKIEASGTPEFFLRKCGMETLIKIKNLFKSLRAKFSMFSWAVGRPIRTPAAIVNNLLLTIVIKTVPLALSLIVA